MTQALLETVDAPVSTGGTNLSHFFCSYCFPDVTYQFAFCLTDISDDGEKCGEDEVDCIMCLDIDICPSCKGEWE